MTKHDMPMNPLHALPIVLDLSLSRVAVAPLPVTTYA